MIFKHSKKFRKQLPKLSENIQKVFFEKVILLEKDFTYPSLRIKKMKGFENPEIWEMSLNMDFRVTFEIWGNNIIFFRKIGNHEILKNP